MARTKARYSLLYSNDRGLTQNNLGRAQHGSSVMLDHDGRRRLLYNAVTLLEPYASAALIQHYVARRHDLTLPLLRIYVDLERLVGAGHLIRHIKPRIGGEGTTFFWETPGLVLVEPDRPPLNKLAAGAPLSYPAPVNPGARGLGFPLVMAETSQSLARLL
jgi:hypothetical protein